MAVIEWDSWNTVEEALRDSVSIPLVVVCFAHSWSPPAIHSAKIFCDLRNSKEFLFCKIFVVDPDKDIAKSRELGVFSSPMVFFLWKGKPLMIRRPGWDDNVKFVGAASRENWIEMIRFGREIGEKGQDILHVDF